MSGLHRTLKNGNALISNLRHKFCRDCKSAVAPPYQRVRRSRCTPGAAASELEREPMPSPRLLVIEGNSPQTTAEHVAAGGAPASKGYSDLLREPLPGVSVDICYPGEPTALLPEGSSLEGYDGIAITGSSLHIYNVGPEVTRQIELVRAALKTGTPLFGSCWGLQVITA